MNLSCLVAVRKTVDGSVVRRPTLVELLSVRVLLHKCVKSQTEATEQRAAPPPSPSSTPTRS